MRLTERDLQLVRWVNGHKFVTSVQVQRFFGMSQAVAYRRLGLLVEDGYLIYERIFMGKPGVYLATAKGVSVAVDELTPGRMRLGSYEHDSQLVDLSIILQEKTGGEWIPERRLRHEKGLEGVGVPGHVADGIMRLPNGLSVGVELELSHKATKRLDNILRVHQKQMDYREVWYFCGSQGLAERVNRKAPNFRVFLWPDLKELKVTESTGSTDKPKESPAAWFRGDQKEAR